MKASKLNLILVALSVIVAITFSPRVAFAYGEDFDTGDYSSYTEYSPVASNPEMAEQPTAIKTFVVTFDSPRDSSGKTAVAAAEKLDREVNAWLNDKTQPKKIIIRVDISKVNDMLIYYTYHYTTVVPTDKPADKLSQKAAKPKSEKQKK